MENPRKEEDGLELLLFSVVIKPLKWSQREGLTTSFQISSLASLHFFLYFLQLLQFPLPPKTCIGDSKLLLGGKVRVNDGLLTCPECIPCLSPMKEGWRCSSTTTGYREGNIIDEQWGGVGVKRRCNQLNVTLFCNLVINYRNVSTRWNLWFSSTSTEAQIVHFKDRMRSFTGGKEIFEQSEGCVVGKHVIPRSHRLVVAPHSGFTKYAADGYAARLASPHRALLKLNLPVVSFHPFCSFPNSTFSLWSVKVCQCFSYNFQLQSNVSFQPSLD